MLIPKLIPVHSSNIAAIGHDKDHTLYIRFLKGDVYSYPNVLYSTMLQMLTAESVGKFFHAHIKTLPEYSKVKDPIEESGSDLIVEVEVSSGSLKKGTPEAAGYDLPAKLDEPVGIEPNQRCLIGTGICIAMPDYVCAIVTPRSGRAIKDGLTVLNAPGLIDPDYRGEIKVILHNSSDEKITINPGDNIAQIVFLPFISPRFVPVKELRTSARGEGGFGSTGD